MIENLNTVIGKRRRKKEFQVVLSVQLDLQLQAQFNNSIVLKSFI